MSCKSYDLTTGSIRRRNLMTYLQTWFIEEVNLIFIVTNLNKHLILCHPFTMNQWMWSSFAKTSVRDQNQLMQTHWKINRLGQIKPKLQSESKIFKYSSSPQNSILIEQMTVWPVSYDISSFYKITVRCRTLDFEKLYGKSNWCKVSKIGRVGPKNWQAEGGLEIKCCLIGRTGQNNLSPCTDLLSADTFSKTLTSLSVQDVWNTKCLIISH